MERVVKEQLTKWISELAEIGTFAGGGLWRQPFTLSDMAAKQLLSNWMNQSGLTPRIDSVGNLIGRLEGNTESWVIMVGSHLDTVKSGGAYDGALGILTGLTAVAELNRQFGPPKKHIEVIAIAGEEQSRFKVPFMGSRGLIGDLKEDELNEIRDVDGQTVAGAMSEVGLDATQICRAKREDIACFIELHIEQGRVLESSNTSTGAVSTIVGITQKSYAFLGEPDHGGTTPLSLRKDALQGAVRIIGRIPEICKRVSETSVATVGIIEAKPGGVSIVPAQVTFTLDVRDIELAAKRSILAQIDALVASTAKELNLQYTQRVFIDQGPVQMDSALCNLILKEAQTASISCMRMHSWGGHDAMIMARRVPSVMIFVPSKGGKSHSPDEYTGIDDAMKGAMVLLGVLKRLAYE